MMGKLIVSFSIILMIVLGIMFFIIRNKNITNDNVPLIFVGIFFVLLIIFICIFIKIK